MSSTMTFGFSFGALSIRDRPSLNVPTTSNSGSRRFFKASSTKVWSSARMIRGRFITSSNFIGSNRSRSHRRIQKSAWPLGFVRQVLVGTQGNQNCNLCSLQALRLDLNRSADEVKSFSHADETQTLFHRVGFHVKTTTVIRYRNANSVVTHFQVHLDRSRTAMSDAVAQRFLHNPKSAQGHILGKSGRKTFLLELNH